MRKVIWLIPLAITLGLYAYWTQQPSKQSRDAAMNAPITEPGNAVLATPSDSLSNLTTEELEKRALNVDETGDTRAEAIEKLSQAPDDHVLSTLTALAARSLPKSGGGLFVAQERVFAAMAIEGILNHPSKEQQQKSLEVILKSQSDQFIITRANMALGFIKGLTPHPKEVDEKNLSNLFE